MNFIVRSFKFYARGLVFTGVSLFHSASGVTATVAWSSNTDPNLAGYNLYYGPTNTAFQKLALGNVTSTTLSNLAVGVTYAFYATAYNSAGLESSPSSEVTYKYDCCNSTLEDMAASGIKVHFNSVLGNTYAVEAKDNFPSGAWQTLGSSLSGTDGAMEVIDPLGANVSNRVYRVRSTSPSTTLEWAGFRRIALNGNSDTLLSLPFLRPAAAYVTVNSLLSPNEIEVNLAADWTTDQWVYSGSTQSNTFSLMIRSGAHEGESYVITANTANTVTLDLQGANLAGLSAGDTLAVVPCWTLGTIFPGGKGVNASPSAGSRSTEVLIPDLSGVGMNHAAARIYYYWNGAWRQVGQGNTVKNDDVILADMYVWVRQNVPNSTELLTMGSVVSERWKVDINRYSGGKQDNFLALPRPTALSLNACGLIESGAFQASPSPGNHADELLVFDNSSLGLNKSAAATYYYWNNAWRKVGAGSADVGSESVLTPGTGIIIRAAAGSAPSVWSNAPVY